MFSRDRVAGKRVKRRVTSFYIVMLAISYNLLACCTTAGIWSDIPRVAFGLEAELAAAPDFDLRFQS